MNLGAERKLFLRVFKGDVNAVEFVENCAEISQVWDDLVDCDTPMDKSEINRAFRLALIEIPSNPFYNAFRQQLTVMLNWVITDWMLSNKLAGQGDYENRVAFVIRDSFSSMVIQCVSLLHGNEWAMEVAESIKIGLDRDDYDQFVKENPV